MTSPQKFTPSLSSAVISILKLLPLIALISASLISCTGKRGSNISPYDPEFTPDKDEKSIAEEQLLDADQQLAKLLDALQLYEDELFTAAREALNSLQRQYPSSYFAPLIELKLADANYYLGDYSTAIEVYEEFIRLRPHHEATPYARLQIANSYFSQYRGVVFDQAPLVQAEKEYKKAIQAHPKSSVNILAKSMLEKCEDLKKKHEGYVAQFYHNQGLKRASINRTKNLLEDIELREAKYFLGTELYREVQKDVSEEEIASLQAKRSLKDDKLDAKGLLRQRLKDASRNLRTQANSMSGRGENVAPTPGDKTKELMHSCSQLENGILLEVILPGELSNKKIYSPNDTSWSMSIVAEASRPKKLEYSLIEDSSCSDLGLELVLKNQNHTLLVQSKKGVLQPKFLLVDRPNRLIALFPS